MIVGTRARLACIGFAWVPSCTFVVLLA